MPSSTMRVAVIGDAHDSPRLGQERFWRIGREVRKRGVDAIVQIGDFLSLDSLSRHDANDTLRGKRKPSFEADMVSFARALDLLNNGLGKGQRDCPKHVTLGNHEDRIMSWTDRTPEMEGVLVGALQSALEGAGWAWSAFGHLHTIEGVSFTHVAINALGKPFGGLNAEAAMARHALGDLVVGHSHVLALTVGRKVGHQSVRVMNAGCALPFGHIEDYAKHGLTGWSYGISFLEIRRRQVASWSWVDMREIDERWGP